MKIKPSERQLRFLDWEFGIFFHFGIRTFNHNHHDWDGIGMSPDSFMPTALDVNQWLNEAKCAGAKYAVLTTKHHDGFCIWQTKYTDYSVASSPWKNGKGDVVREFTDACHKFGIACGLYYSPAQWDAGSGHASETAEYNDYVIGQLTELLTGYGKIDYLWLDSAFSKAGIYDAERIKNTIRSLQPDILIFTMFDPDTCGVGNEDGYVDARNFYTKTIDVMGKPETRFLAAEGDCRLRDSWFYDSNESSIKSLEELVGMYETTVGRGATFLLNIGPDERGLLADADVRRLREFSSAIRERYFTPLPMEQFTIEPDGRLSVSYSQKTYADKICDTVNLPLVRRAVIEEDLTDGEAVKAWRLYATIPSKYPYIDWEYVVCEGHGIGHKHICVLPPMRTPRLRLEITDSDGEYKIKSIKAYS